MPLPTRILAAAVLLLACAGHAPPALASSNRATVEDAQDMVKRAVEMLKKDGEEKTYKEISKFEGRFMDRDLYLVVIDMDGICLASGSRSVPIGQNLLEFRDSDSKAVVKERLEIAKTQSAFWQSYKFLDPLTRRVFPKQAYCQTYKKTVVCGGVYNTP